MKKKISQGKPTPNVIKIGLDLHGVVDARPRFFATLTQLLVKQGHEVHIISGGLKKNEKAQLKKLGVAYTHFFSISDHHNSLGTPIRWDKNGNPHLDAYVWDKTKGEYCAKHGIDLHFDDSDLYAYFFKTPYARFLSKDTRRIKKIHH